MEVGRSRRQDHAVNGEFLGWSWGRNIEVNYQTSRRRGVKVTGEKEASLGFLDKTDDEV